jgi:hypothetical protein
MFKKFQEGDINDVEVWDRRIRRLNGIGFSWSLAPSSPTSSGEDSTMHRDQRGEERRNPRAFHEEYSHREGQHDYRGGEDGDGGSLNDDDEFSPNNSEEV